MVAIIYLKLISRIGLIEMRIGKSSDNSRSDSNSNDNQNRQTTTCACGGTVVWGDACSNPICSGGLR